MTDDVSNNGERQVAPTLSGIRADHLARYAWAAKHLKPKSTIIDAGCGVGYGAKILADAGHTVLAYDQSAAAIAYAREHYGSDRITYSVADLAAPHRFPEADAAVCFELVEHLADPLPLLDSLADQVAALVVSAPNEARFPYRCRENGFRGWAHHHRHYTRDDLEGLLQGAGWRPILWLGQEGPESGVVPGVEGRTLVALAERASVPAIDQVGKGTPEHVAILGLGGSLSAYLDIVKKLGNRRLFANEVWGVNAVGNLVQCDRIFHMDDVRIQEIRAAAQPKSNIAAMLGWMRDHPGPIYTSAVRPGYPGLVAFPLEAVLNDLKMAYFNNTVAYAVALAIHIGVRRISFFGVDYTYPNAHDAEKGRACVEFWLGVAHARGIEAIVAETSTLMDAFEPEDRCFYGYDAFHVKQRTGDGGGLRIDLEPRDTLPTAAEIEAAYDHSKHPHTPAKS